MDATTMPSTASLVRKLRTDFPNFTFKASQDFRWSPDEKTIFFQSPSDDQASLLHELSHAVLGHTQYTKDIGLLELERDAWDYSRRILALGYGVVIDEDLIQDSLDTYRDWLHARSTCPNCNAIGLQIKKYTYSCIACSAQWSVNDARTCALRRYSHTK